MKHCVPESGKFIGILVMVLLLAAKNDWATTHVIQFGGSLGFVYSPKDFSATVGDTVEWEGDFSVHPLSSTTIPANAPSWHNTSGTSFEYVITVPGNYNYQCDVHFSIGMVGSFEVSAAAVRQVPLSANAGNPNQVVFVDATASGNSVSFFVPSTQFVTLEVFDLLGRRIETLVNQTKEPGTYTSVLKAGIPAHGLYFARLAGNGSEEIRTLKDLNRQ